MKKNLYLVCLAITLAACNSRALFPIEPQIAYVDIQPRQAKEYQDSIIITFTFTDGDGDLGDIVGGDKTSLYVTDGRTQFPDSLRTISFQIPDLQQNTKNPAIQGKITLVYPPTIVTPGRQTDSTSYSVYIVDRAGHKSNVITTDKVYLSR